MSVPCVFRSVPWKRRGDTAVMMIPNRWMLCGELSVSVSVASSRVWLDAPSRSQPFFAILLLLGQILRVVAMQWHDASAMHISIQEFIYYVLITRYLLVNVVYQTKGIKHKMAGALRRASLWLSMIYVGTTLLYVVVSFRTQLFEFRVSFSPALWPKIPRRHPFHGLPLEDSHS